MIPPYINQVSRTVTLSHWYEHLQSVGKVHQQTINISKVLHLEWCRTKQITSLRTVLWNRTLNQKLPHGSPKWCYSKIHTEFAGFRPETNWKWCSSVWQVRLTSPSTNFSQASFYLYLFYIFIFQYYCSQKLGHLIHTPTTWRRPTNSSVTNVIFILEFKTKGIMSQQCFLP